jgi:benzoylformate decarboxylase
MENEMNATTATTLPAPAPSGRTARAAGPTTVREAFFEVARRLGLTTIFGNPGSTEETFLKDFPSDFRYVLALQEAAVVGMADGYAQATGKAALVSVHTAAGLGNAMGNIESAWYNHAPLIITAGNQVREMLLLEPFLASAEPTMIPHPYVKWSWEVARPEDAPAALIRAWAMAVQPPAGPVFLSIPMSDAEKPSLPVPEARAVTTRLAASTEQLSPVARLLDEAAAPVLVIGGTVDEGDGWDNAVRLAERLNAPVWAAPEEGRPGFPETHPLYRGYLPAAIKPLCDKLEGHDLVVVIGAPVFRYYPYVPGDYIPHGTRLVHITDNPAEAARAPVGDSILTDPGTACGVLADLVSSSARPLPPALTPSPRPPVGTTITADLLYFTINELRPADSVLVVESEGTIKMLRDRLPTSSPRSFFHSYSGVLGYGLSAAVGVALAERDLGTHRKVVNIVGDGAAQYVIQSIWTAVQQRLPILIIIPANHEYAILKEFADELGTPGVPGLDLPGFDFVSLAKGYGCDGRRIVDPKELEPALREAMVRESPYLLEVEIDPAYPSLL